MQCLKGSRWLTFPFLSTCLKWGKANMSAVNFILYQCKHCCYLRATLDVGGVVYLLLFIWHIFSFYLNNLYICLSCCFFYHLTAQILIVIRHRLFHHFLLKWFNGFSYLSPNSLTITFFCL